MNETIENIMNRISFRRKDDFRKHLLKCIHTSTNTKMVSHEEHENVIFKLLVFLQEFTPFLYEHGKEKKYLSGVEALLITIEELGYEIEKEDVFVLFHLREHGRFKVKESKLKEELELLWKSYPEFKLEGNELSYTLKDLMRKKLINYRKGNLEINPNVLIRYRQG